MMNNVRSFWLAFMAASRRVQWLTKILAISVMAAFGYYIVLQPERDAVERAQRLLLHAGEARTALVRRLADFPDLSTLQQQWDALPEKIPNDGTKTLTERILLPLSASEAMLLTLQPQGTAHFQKWKLIVSTNFFGALTFIQQLTVSPHLLKIHSLSLRLQQDGLHMEMQLALPDFNEGEQQ